MFIPRLHSGLVLALGLAIAHGALVRADPANQPSLADLAQARFDAANKLFDTAWSYYRQKTTGTGFVYFTSSRLLRAELDLSNKRDNRIAAYEHHLCRVKKLQALVAKVQALGRANTLEATEVSYYRAEAEYWRHRHALRPRQEHIMGELDPWSTNRRSRRAGTVDPVRSPRGIDAGAHFARAIKRPVVSLAFEGITAPGSSLKFEIASL